MTVHHREGGRPTTINEGNVMNARRATGLSALLSYIATIVLANYAIHHWGRDVFGTHVVSVGFGKSAPSGVYFVALALVLRNVVQRQLGRFPAVAAILVGSAISWWVADPALAKASAAAFLASEALDMLIYTPLSEHGKVWAVLPASLAGAALDSWLFLRIAFHSESFWSAQMLGKTYGVLAATLVLAGAQLAIPKRRQLALA